MEFVDRVVEKCARAGADLVEAFNLVQRRLSISVRDGQVEAIKKATPGGLAVRFYMDGKIAFGHTTDVSDESIDKMILKLSALAQKTVPDEFAHLPGRQQYEKDLDIYDVSFIDQPMDAKIQYLKDLESLALKYDPLITKSNGVGYDEFLVTRALGNSNGVSVSWDATLYRVGISVVAEKKGEMYPGEGSIFACHYADLPEPSKIVEHFASKAVRLVGGTPVEGGDYEIIFVPRAVNSLLWGLSFALNGDNSFKDASFLADKLGQKIAVDSLNLYDDGLMRRGVGSRPADDEGVAATKQALIENGVLRGFLYDTRTALKAKATPTGSSFREDYSSFPQIGVSNFYVAAGKDKVEDVVAACKKGIIVEDTQGWGLHSVTGEYSAGINGMLVENGKRIRPVAGVTIAASSNDILMGIGAICDDLRFLDNFSAPTLMVKQMRVGA